MIAILGGDAASLVWPVRAAVGPAAPAVHRDLRGGHPVARLPDRDPGHRRVPGRHPDAVRAGRRRRARGVAARRVARPDPGRRRGRDPRRGGHPPARARARSSPTRPPSPSPADRSRWPRAPRRIRILHRRRPRHGPSRHARLPRPARRPRGRRRGRRRARRPSSVVADAGPTSSSWTCCMPVIDGIEATRRIKAAQPEVEVVALTSFIEEERVVGGHRGRGGRVPAQGRRGRRPGRRHPGGRRGRGPPRSGRGRASSRGGCVAGRAAATARGTAGDGPGDRARAADRRASATSWPASPAACPTGPSPTSSASPSGRPGPTSRTSWPSSA